MHLVVVLTALVVNASAPGFELVWLAPENCATRPDTAALVGDAVGHAEVQLREDADGWLVTVLFFRPEEGVRRVKVPGCEEAVRAASLLVKLGSQGALPAEEKPQPVVERPVAPPPIVAAPEKQTPVAPTEPWHFSLAGGAAIDVGTLPRVEPRFAVSANLTHALLRMALDVRFGLPLRTNEFLHAQRLVEVQGAGCFNFSWRALSGGPCLAASVGSWKAKTDWNSEATVATASVGAQARAFVLIVAGLELGVLAGVRVNVARPRVTMAGVPVFTTGLIAGDFQATLGWRW